MYDDFKAFGIPMYNISHKGEKLHFKAFKYQVVTTTPDARCDTGIKKLIAISKDVFTKMKSLLTNGNISLTTEIYTLKAHVWSGLLYRCTCWTLTKELERKLEAAELWFMQIIMRLSLLERKINEEVMEMSRYRRSLLKVIRERQLEFLGM